MAADPAGPVQASHHDSCHHRPWLHRLCRWALPAAFVAGAGAIWLTASAGVGLAVVGLVLLLCPVACVALLLWQSRHSERALTAAVGDELRQRLGRNGEGRPGR